MTSDTDDTPTVQNRASGKDEISVLSILFRDALALRQRLFSYLQFYLTAQAGLAVLFGIVAHDSYDVLQLPSAKLVLLISVLGLLASFLVIAYGLFVLRPGEESRLWISRQMEKIAHFSDVAEWADACRLRLDNLLASNTTLDKKVTWIRVGILIQLGCGFLVFILSLRL